MTAAVVSPVARALQDRNWKLAVNAARTEESAVLNWAIRVTVARGAVTGTQALRWGVDRAQRKGNTTAAEILSALIPWVQERRPQQPTETTYQRTRPLPSRSTTAATATADHRGNAIQHRRTTPGVPRRRDTGHYRTTDTDSCDDRERDKPITCDLDYDRAGVLDARGRCIGDGCGVEPSQADREQRDGLCQDCRERGAPGLTLPAAATRVEAMQAWCDYIVAHYTNPVGALRGLYRRHTADEDRAVICSTAHRFQQQPPASAQPRSLSVIPMRRMLPAAPVRLALPPAPVRPALPPAPVAPAPCEDCQRPRRARDTDHGDGLCRHCRALENAPAPNGVLHARA